MLCIISNIPFTYATTTTAISLSDSKITVNGETIDDNNIYTDITSIDLSNMTKQENSTINNRGPGRPEDFKNTKTTTSKSNMIIKYAIINTLIVITVFIVSVTVISLIKKN